MAFVLGERVCNTLVKAEKAMSYYLSRGEILERIQNSHMKCYYFLQLEVHKTTAFPLVLPCVALKRGFRDSS